MVVCRVASVEKRACTGSAGSLRGRTASSSGGQCASSRGYRCRLLAQRQTGHAHTHTTGRLAGHTHRSSVNWTDTRTTCSTNVTLAGDFVVAPLAKLAPNLLGVVATVAVADHGLLKLKPQRAERGGAYMISALGSKWPSQLANSSSNHTTVRPTVSLCRSLVWFQLTLSPLVLPLCSLQHRSSPPASRASSYHSVSMTHVRIDIHGHIHTDTARLSSAPPPPTLQ